MATRLRTANPHSKLHKTVHFEVKKPAAVVQPKLTAVANRVNSLRDFN
jgi:hypothetical protein